MNSEILKFIREKGLLVEKEVFDLVSALEDVTLAKSVLELLARFSGQKIVTKSVLTQHAHSFQSAMQTLPGDQKKSVERVFINLGLQLEIRKEIVHDTPAPSQFPLFTLSVPPSSASYQIFMPETHVDKKLDVTDFTGNFRARYQQLQSLLMQRPELHHLISLNKISGVRQNLSIIGMVREKRMTKQNNLLIRFEDLTGEIVGLVKANRAEIFAKALELQLDDVVAVKASGDKDMLFVHDVFFPDAHVEKVRFQEEATIAFLSDVHCGSDRHLGKSFQNFLYWIKNTADAQKLKYIFFVGDNVDGVGIFPGQEHLLALKSMKEQYTLLASYLQQIPKHITLFMCPGQHDATRVAEPQPLIDRKYAEPLYRIDNLVLVTNPALVKLKEGEREFKVLMYHGASIHTFIAEIPELREMKAHRCPAKAVVHMLKRRHLAPTHSSVVYIPHAEKDPLVIHEVPDLLCTGEVHRLDIENYHGILIVTGSCWQAQTEYEEKVGNIPDPCKVPVFNLKTRELKVYDFSVEEEMHEHS